MDLKDLELGLETANKELYIEKLDIFVNLNKTDKVKAINEQKKINKGFDFLEEMIFANIEIEKKVKKLKKLFSQKQIEKILKDHLIEFLNPKTLPSKYKKLAGEEYYYLVQEEYAKDQFNSFCNSKNLDLMKLEQDLLILENLISIKSKGKKTL